MALSRNVVALFPLPSERRVVSYVTTYYAPDDDEGEIESDDGEEHDAEEFGDVEDSDTDEDYEPLGVSWTEAVYDYLDDQGVHEASSSHFHPGIWYLAGDESWDVNGEMEQRTYHLKGFPKAEEKAIYELLKRRKRIS